MPEYAGADKEYTRTLPVTQAGGELEVLMKRYQGGDSGAATALVRRVAPQLHRYFLAQSKSRTDADDLLQETWLRIHKVRHTYRTGEPVLPWFYAIARHVRVDHYRRALRTSAREQQLEQAASVVATAGTNPMEKQDDLATLLAPLPESQREVLEMLKVAGMSLEEVARATSSSVGSVKQKVHRAYKKLRETLGSMEFGKGRTGDVP